MNAIFVKEDCAVAIAGKENKPKDMTDNSFNKNDQLAITDFLLTLDDSVLFNMSD